MSTLRAQLNQLPSPDSLSGGLNFRDALLANVVTGERQTRNPLTTELTMAQLKMGGSILNLADSARNTGLRSWPFMYGVIATFKALDQIGKQSSEHDLYFSIGHLVHEGRPAFETAIEFVIKRELEIDDSDEYRLVFDKSVAGTSMRKLVDTFPGFNIPYISAMEARPALGDPSFLGGIAFTGLALAEIDLDV